MVTAHIFFDKGGFFTNKAIEFIEKIAPKKHFYYYSSTKEINNQNINIINNEVILFELIEKKEIQKVIFHSLHFFQFDILKKIKKKNNQIIVGWIFWSFEFYQLPFNLYKLYSKNNRKFYLRKLLSIFYENFILIINKKNLTFLNLFKPNYLKAIEKVDEFYSFIEDDCYEIFLNKKINYSFLPYLDSSDLTSTNKIKSDKTKIMIGHSGSPLLNHIEICNIIEKFEIDTECLFSLSYGNKKYISEIKKKITNNFNFNYKILDKRLPLQEYNEILNSISIFFLNAYCQQGLGNIVYFLNNGTAIYLSEKSTTYRFLKRKGFIVFSIERIEKREDIKNLSSSEIKRNSILINQMLEPNYVSKQWSKLLS